MAQDKGWSCLSPWIRIRISSFQSVIRSAENTKKAQTNTISNTNTNTWVARELVRLVQTLPSTELGAASWFTLVKPLTLLIFTAVSWPAELPRTKTASSSWVRWEQAKEGRRVDEGQERVCWCSLALAALAWKGEGGYSPLDIRNKKHLKISRTWSQYLPPPELKPNFRRGQFPAGLDGGRTVDVHYQRWALAPPPGIKENYQWKKVTKTIKKERKTTTWPHASCTETPPRRGVSRNRILIRAPSRLWLRDTYGEE